MSAVEVAYERARSASRERRERIATAILASMSISDNPTMQLSDAVLADCAVRRADALITELDKDS